MVNWLEADNDDVSMVILSVAGLGNIDKLDVRVSYTPTGTLAYFITVALPQIDQFVQMMKMGPRAARGWAVATVAALLVGGLAAGGFLYGEWQLGEARDLGSQSALDRAR